MKASVTTIVATFFIFTGFSCKQAKKSIVPIKNKGVESNHTEENQGKGVTKKVYNDPFDQAIEELRRAFVKGSRNFSQEQKSDASNLESLFSFLKEESSKMSHEELREVILTPAFDDFISQFDPDFYQRITRPPQESQEINDKIVCTENIPTENKQKAEMIDQREAKQESTVTNSSVNNVQEDKESNSVIEGNEENDKEPENESLALASHFLQVQLIMSMMVAMQKSFNVINDIGVSDKSNKAELARMRKVNSASLGLTLLFVALSGTLLIQGESHQSEILIYTLSFLTILDAFFNISEIRSYFIEGKTLITGGNGTGAKIGNGGSLEIIPSKLGYAKVFGAIGDVAKNLPKKIYHFISDFLAKPSNVFANKNKPTITSLTHQDLLDNYYNGLRSLSLNDSDAKNYWDDWNQINKQLNKLKLEYASLALFSHKKRSIKRQMDDLNLRLSELTISRVKTILSSKEAKDLLADLIVEARKNNIALNLPSEYKPFLHLDNLKANSEFAALYQKNEGFLAERYAQPTGSMSERLKTLRGFSGAMLIGGASSLLIMTAVGVGSIINTFSTKFNLIDEDAKEVSQVFYLIRKIFAQKYGFVCSP